MNLKKILSAFSCLLAVGVCFINGNAYGQKRYKDANLSIVNFDKKGRQIIRYSNLGDALDAHDGEIAFFNGTYYLYGTSYDCGFEWQNKSAAFCGFKVYS